MNSLSRQDELKRAVAQAAVDYILPKLNSESIVGIGTGSTSNFFIDQLAPHRGLFNGTVASSDASAERLKRHGIAVYDLNDILRISCYIDGADESNHNLQLIKGGGGALTREKIVVACADEFVCIADQSKWVDTLGSFPLPVEVIPMAVSYVTQQLESLGGDPVYRAGVVTDNGNCILDVHGLAITDPCQMETAINQIAGVVTNGLFALRPADILLLATESGVETKRRPS